MYLLNPLLSVALATVAYAQESVTRPITLPELAPPPKISAVVSQPTPPAPPASPASKEPTRFAVYQNTVYFKVGDMVVPMIGTSGCFTPKELLKAGDPRLQFGDEIPPPPPPIKQ